MACKIKGHPRIGYIQYNHYHPLKPLPSEVSVLRLHTKKTEKKNATYLTNLTVYPNLMSAKPHSRKVLLFY